MTREEAIEEIRYYCQDSEKIIEALEQMPSEDCVSRKAMLDAITEIDENINMDIYTNEVREIIRDLPPVTPARKKGKWIITDKEYGRIWHCHCSNCKKDPQDCVGGTENWWLVRLPDYCPNCGAEMESELWI